MYADSVQLYTVHVLAFPSEISFMEPSLWLEKMQFRRAPHVKGVSFNDDDVIIVGNE